MKDIQDLEKKINYIFKDKGLLTTALTHSSYTNENVGSESNERLEFLGDAILQYISTELLFGIYKEEQEGRLTIYRSLLVNTEHLAEIADELDLYKYIRMSVGQKKNMENRSHSILADAVEAIIAAIYQDGGLKPSTKFINDFLLKDPEKYLSEKDEKDEKSLFQEMSQKEYNITPRYAVEKEEGPDDHKIFFCSVYIGDEKVASAKGASKKECYKEAARKANEVKGWKSII